MAASSCMSKRWCWSSKCTLSSWGCCFASYTAHVRIGVSGGEIRNWNSVHLGCLLQKRKKQVAAGWVVCRWILNGGWWTNRNSFSLKQSVAKFNSDFKKITEWPRELSIWSASRRTRVLLISGAPDSRKRRFHEQDEWEINNMDLLWSSHGSFSVLSVLWRIRQYQFQYIQVQKMVPSSRYFCASVVCINSSQRSACAWMILFTMRNNLLIQLPNIMPNLSNCVHYFQNMSHLCRRHCMQIVLWEVKIEWTLWY